MQAKNLPLFILCILTLTVVGLLSFSVPVYTDEIMLKLDAGRLFLDQGKLTGMMPQCTKYYDGQPAGIWYPLASAAAIFYENIYVRWAQPFTIRVIGILSFFAFILLPLVLLITKLKSKNILKYAVIAGICGGVVPLALIINRPEQEIAGFILWSIAVILLGPTKWSSRQDIFRFIILNLGAAFLMYLHPKVVFYGLLYFLFIWLIIKNNKLRFLSFVFAILILGFKYQQTLIWNCPEDAETLAAWNKAAELGLHLKRFAGVITPFYFNTEFDSNYVSGWIPQSEVSIVESISDIIFRSICTVGIVYAIFRVFILIKHRRYNLETYRRPILGAVLLFSTVIYRLIYGVEAFYETTLSAVALTASVLLLLPDDAQQDKKLTNRIATVVLTISIISLVLLLIRMVNFKDKVNSAGVIPEQKFSVGVMNYDSWLAQIKSAAIPCGLDPATKHYRPLLDETTIIAFQHSIQPTNLTYLYDWSANSLDHLGVLKAIKSDGAVGLCHRLEKIKGIQLIKTGDLCCAGAFK